MVLVAVVVVGVSAIQGRMFSLMCTVSAKGSSVRLVVQIATQIIIMPVKHGVSFVVIELCEFGVVAARGAIQETSFAIWA